MTKLLLPYGSARYLGEITVDGSARSNQVTKLGVSKGDLVTKVGNIKAVEINASRVIRLQTPR